MNPWATVWEALEERLGSSPSQRFAHGAHSVANNYKLIGVKLPSKAHIFKADLPGGTEERGGQSAIAGGELRRWRSEGRGRKKKKSRRVIHSMHRVERAHGNFLHRFQLPENTDMEAFKSNNSTRKNEQRNEVQAQTA